MENCMNDSRITQEEMTALFGETMPIEAFNLIADAPEDWTLAQVRERLRQIAVEKRDESDFGKMTAAEIVAHFEARLEKAGELPWRPSWNTKRHENFEWMEASGPQTMALAPDDPRFRELVQERAFADAELMADAVNALPRIMELLRDSDANPQGVADQSRMVRQSESVVRDSQGRERYARRLILLRSVPLTKPSCVIRASEQLSLHLEDIAGNHALARADARDIPVVLRARLRHRGDSRPVDTVLGGYGGPFARWCALQALWRRLQSYGDALGFAGAKSRCRKAHQEG
jgi:hypothetical protein